MRKKLKKLAKGRQHTFIAEVGIVNSGHVMLKNVRLIDDGSYVTQHVWIVKSRRCEYQHFKAGDKIRFAAKVHGYDKGPLYEKHDYGLSSIRKIQKLDFA